MKEKKQRFWRLTDLGSDRLAVVDERLLAGATASSIADLIVRKWGAYADDIESGQLKLDSFIRQISRYKKSVKKRQVALVDQPGTDVVVRDERPTPRARKSIHVLQLEGQIEKTQAEIDRIEEKMVKDGALLGSVHAKKLADEKKHLIALYGRLNAAIGIDDRQHRRGLGTSDLYFEDEVEQATIQHRTNVLARRAASALVPELLECLIGASDDPPPPPMTEADKEEVRAIYNEYNGDVLKHFGIHNNKK